MRKKRVLKMAFGLENAVVEGVDFDEVAAALIVSVRPTAKARHRCGRCGRRSPRYDQGAATVAALGPGHMPGLFGG